MFTNEEFGKLRTLSLNNEVWFVGKDVAVALGYAKPENAISAHVDTEDKTTTLIQGSGSNYKSKTTIINESGLYSLIISSKLPSAKKFKHWVTSEVLPSIRKTGTYTIDTNSSISPSLQMFKILLDKAIEAEKIQNEHSRKIELLETSVKKMQADTNANTASWIDYCVKQMSKFAAFKGIKNPGVYYKQLFNYVEQMTGVNLNRRLERKRDRAISCGMSKTNAGKITKLDVIADDKELRKVYTQSLNKLFETR